MVKNRGRGFRTHGGITHGCVAHICNKPLCHPSASLFCMMAYRPLPFGVRTPLRVGSHMALNTAHTMTGSIWSQNGWWCWNRTNSEKLDRFTVCCPPIEHTTRNGCRSGNRTHLRRLMRPLCSTRTVSCNKVEANGIEPLFARLQRAVLPLNYAS